MAFVKGLSFEVGVGSNGEHTVYREVEPVFCFVRETEDEAVALARATIESYFQYFKQETRTVTFQKTSSIPTQKIRRSGRYSVETEPMVAVA